MTLAPSDSHIRIPDLSDPATFVDDVPHEAFAEIRRRPGLYWQPTPVSTNNGGYWAVTRFADIIAIEKDPATFSSANGGAYPLMRPWTGAPFEEPNTLMTADPPLHSRLRRAAAKGFGPRVVANFEPWIREIVREMIERVKDQPRFDYVEAFARTVPAYVIARVVGAPKEDREKLVDMTMALFAATQDPSGKGAIYNMQPIVAQIIDYVTEIQAYKRENPGDDMFTALIECLDRGEITQVEFGQWLMLMLTAGFETTHTAIGQSMRMYLENEEVHERMDRALDEGLTPRAVDEFIRLISPPMEMARTATKDTFICDTEIKEGDVVVNYFIAANRDPSVFSDPDRFDPWRTETDTLAFGSGVHRCIGSYLAKLEVQILWEELRAQDLRLKLAGEPVRGWSNFINQLTELPVERI